MSVLRAAFLMARIASLVTVIRALTRGGTAAAPVRMQAVTNETSGSITVVVPARNEAARIGPLLEALAAMSDAELVDEVIVVDDGSTDDTASIANTAGARVLPAGPVPTGWLGKAWAVEQGVRAATGRWIVTFDADTRPAVSLPSAAVDRCRADGIDLLTLAPAVECPTWGAAWLHPSMLTTLVFRYGRPGVEVPSGRQLANGQCMVFRRQWFVDGRGFGNARGASEEDVAFARMVAGRGDRVAFLEANELLSVRAYEGFRDTWRGWGRSIGLPSVTSPTQRFVDVVVLACTMPLPWLRLAARRVDAIDAIAIACRLGTLVGTRRTYAPCTTSPHTRLAYWLSPCADPLAWFSVVSGSIPLRRRWRGRSSSDG